jgi:molybdopterin synthase catalytic subunit
VSVAVVTKAFDPQAEIASFCAGRTDVGAIASFVGLCRDATDGKGVMSLYLDHYPGFTEKEIARVEAEAHARFGLLETRIVHRAGMVAPGAPIVLVLAASTHRAAAFEAVAFMMDYLKTDAPFWKREEGPDGGRWIEPRTSDRDARGAWETKS